MPDRRPVSERPGAARVALIGAGFVCVGLGAIGAFVPLLPTTPFLLLAAFCFARSSERFHGWLLGNRWFGAHIRNYMEHRATTRATKIGSLVMLWSALLATGVFAVESWWWRSGLLLVGVGVSIHLISLRVSRHGAAADGSCAEADEG